MLLPESSHSGEEMVPEWWWLERQLEEVDLGEEVEVVSSLTVN